MIFSFCVIVFVVICYSVFWLNTLKQAKILSSEGEFVKAKQKVENLINPFNNKDIEEIIYFGEITHPMEVVEKLRENPEPYSESYYRAILENLFYGYNSIFKNKPDHIEPPDHIYTYYYLELVGYIDDVYKPVVNLHNEDEFDKHIAQICKNIVAQNRIDASNEKLKQELDTQKITLTSGCSFDENEWVCTCFLKVDKNSRNKYYKEFKIFVTYYDKNYNEILSDSYELEEIYRGYYKNIKIISSPKDNIKPFKYSVWAEYSYAY